MDTFKNKLKQLLSLTLVIATVLTSVNMNAFQFTATQSYASGVSGDG